VPSAIGKFPGTEARAGRLVTLVPLRPEHGDALYHATHGDPEKERVWQYLFDGPFFFLI
jgi:hypothetical protein